MEVNIEADPLYVTREAAWMVGVPERTFSSWTRHDQPVVTRLPGAGASIPFVGLAEGHVAAGFRRAGLSMQRLRKALRVLDEQLGMKHALASRRLYTTGAEILYDYAQHSEGLDLTNVLTGQRVFVPIIDRYLRRIEFGENDMVAKIWLPITERKLLFADPQLGFGRPLFANGAPVDSILRRFRAGEPLESVARDYDLVNADVEDAIRASLTLAA